MPSADDSGHSVGSKEDILDRPGTFAGFTHEEWVAMRALTMDLRDAQREADMIFESVLSQPSQGFALSVYTWALLTLVSGDCESRVRILTASYPDEWLAHLEEVIADYRDLLAHGELRRAHDQARALFLGDQSQAR
ncbi:MAG: hypothetical protein H0W42_03665 [Gemmatimonadaceae bacterium]|nr:hypothetical protein [Gemmatimonadaceae bacterium]